MVHCGLWAKKTDVPLSSLCITVEVLSSSIVVRTLVSTDELSLSCARELAGWVTDHFVVKAVRYRSANIANSATHPSRVGK